MNVGIWQEHFGDRRIEDTFEFLARTGYDSVQVTPWTFTERAPTASAEEIDRVRRAAATHGLDLSGIARVFGGPEDYHVGHPEPAVRDRTREYLEALARLCGDLGGSLITFGSPQQRSVPPGLSPEEAWTNALETFGHPALLETLEEAGVDLGIEPLQPASTDFLNTTPEAVEFIEAIDHPNLTLTIDGYHLVHEPDPIPDLIETYGHHLSDFHADDATGRGPGAGDLEWGPILDALDDVGYDGPVTVELHVLLGRDEAIPADVDPETLAEDALEYLRSV